MAEDGPGEARLRVARLPRAGRPVALVAGEAERARLADELGLIGLPALALEGRLVPAEAEAWRLEARLTARVVQPCVVTLAPVETALDEPVARTWSPHAGLQGAGGSEEAEMGDDELEPLGSVIDLDAVMAEALILALPAWPRAEGAALPEAEAEAEPAAEGAGDATRRPFAELGALLKARDGG